MVKGKNISYGVVLIILPVVFALIIALVITFKKTKTVKIGILHSLTGSLATSERSAIDAKLLAISEINAAGGVLGCLLEPIIADGQSSEEAFRLAAYDLITQHKVAAIFGCYTSSSRKVVKEVVEKYDNILFHGDQFEGLETSKNCVFTGTTGNQNLPMILWAAKNFGPKIFLVGSTVIDSDGFMEITTQFARENNIDIVGKYLIPLSSDDVDGAISAIQAAKPDVVINAIDGDTCIHFFKKLKQAGITADVMPTITISFSEDFFDEIGIKNLIGHYFWGGYFQSIPTIENKKFMAKVSAYFGLKKVITDLMITEYSNVYLWAKAVEEAKSFSDTKKILNKLLNICLETPYGPLLVTKDYYVPRKGFLGKVSASGECVIIWQTSELIPPIPFPATSSQEVWQSYLNSKFKEWGNKWEVSL